MKKEHQSGFCRSWHFGRSGVEKSVQKAFKKRSKPFGSVLELKKAFWSGNNRSGVLFLLNLAKLIDFGFGVEISTIKGIQVYIYILCYISHLKQLKSAHWDKHHGMSNPHTIYLGLLKSKWPAASSPGIAYKSAMVSEATDIALVFFNSSAMFSPNTAPQQVLANPSGTWARGL